MSTCSFQEITKKFVNDMAWIEAGHTTLRQYGREFEQIRDYLKAKGDVTPEEYVYLQGLWDRYAHFRAYFINKGRELSE